MTTPKIDIEWTPPARPDIKPVEWMHGDGRHCLTDEGAKALQVNVSRLWTHIGNCERQIEAMGEALKNK